MSATETIRHRTYGNWRRPVQPGIGSLGVVGTGMVFAGIIAMLIVWFLTGVIPGLVTALVFAAMIGLLAMRDKHGRSGVLRLATRVGWRRTRSSGSHLYRSGPVGRIPSGTCQLPGLAAKSQLFEFADAFGRPFALLHYPSTHTYVVVLRADPQGDGLVDQQQIDEWVAHYGSFLTLVSQEVGLKGAAVTIETAPDPGSRLDREIKGSRVSDAPELASSVMDEIAGSYAAGASTVTGYCTLTYGAAGLAGKARHTDEVARDIGSSLGGLTAQLSAAGGGAVAPLSAQALAETIRAGYDPGAAETLAELHAAGQPPALAWSDVGPVATQAGWDHYRHDSGVSRSWIQSCPPRGAVGSNVLGALVQPHQSIRRKRVTMLYRPYDPARAKELVEQDQRTADFQVSSGRPNARASAAKRAADQIAAEEAAGAALVDFGMIVTATVSEPEQLPAATSAVEMAAGQSRILLRPAYGAQDSTFAAGLPLGLVIPLHLRVPTWFSEAL